MRFRVGWILKNSTQWIHIQAGLELCSGVKILLNADRRGKIGGYHAERVHQGHVRACNDSVTVLSEISPLLYTAATAMILNLCFKITSQLFRELMTPSVLVIAMIALMMMIAVVVR